ncbi:MAG: hypothetical protein R3E66_22330 [bacterium]
MEFKLDATSGQDRMSASIKLEVTDEAKLAQHLGIAKEDLKNLSPQFLLNKLANNPLTRSRWRSRSKATMDTWGRT